MKVLWNKGEFYTQVYEKPFCTQEPRGFSHREVQEKYVEHMKTHHPGEPIKSRKEFFCEVQEARYNGKGGKVSRCC